MDGLQAQLDELFRCDPDGAIHFMLENFHEIRDNTGDIPAAVEGPGDAISGPLAGCTYCGSRNVVVHEAEGDVCCVDCGTCTRDFDNTARALDYDEQVQTGADFYFVPKKSEYKRMQHFCDLLNQLQDNRDVDIPEEVLLVVRRHVVEENAGKKPTIKLVRSILKKMGWGYRQYENAQAILNKVTNNDKDSAMVIPHNVEREMKRIFMMAENAWNHTPGAKASRKSFLSYSYVIKQLLRILHHPDLADRIPTIKSKSRVRSHDQAWESICKVCKIQFIPLLPTL